MYLERGVRERGKLLSRWNLVVPERVLNRSWDAEPVDGRTSRRAYQLRG
jgi:hypothetical protein